MKKQLLLATFAVAALGAQSASAQIVFNSNVGPEQSYGSGGALVANYGATTASNSAILLAVAIDGNTTFSATYGGLAMTPLASDNRTAIFGFLPSDTTAQDITLTVGNTSNSTTVVYGTIEGIDTSIFDVDVITGTSFTSPTSTFSNSLNGLSNGDYVLSVFNENSLNVADVNDAVSGYSTGLSEIYTNADNNFTGGYSASIAGGTIAGSAYIPSATWNGITNGSSASYGSAIAFTAAIPEPSTYAALAGLLALGLVAWRRRRV